MLKWLVSFFKGRPERVVLNTPQQWRCTACGAETPSVPDLDCRRNGVAMLNGKEYQVACPLAPIDDNGNELTFEQWQAMR